MSRPRRNKNNKNNKKENLPTVKQNTDLEGTYTAEPRPSNPNTAANLRKVSVRSASFTGPIPPPEFLARYEEICPGLGMKIFDSSHEESIHRRKMESIIVDAQVEEMRAAKSESKRGQTYGLIITLAAIIAGVTCILHGHDWGGSVLGVGGVSGIVATFVIGRRTGAQDASEREESSGPE